MDNQARTLPILIGVNMWEHKIQPASERFYHSQGLLTEHYPNGAIASTWFCVMPWAAASIREGLAGDYWDFERVAAE